MKGWVNPRPFFIALCSVVEVKTMLSFMRYVVKPTLVSLCLLKVASLYSLNIFFFSF